MKRINRLDPDFKYQFVTFFGWGDEGCDNYGGGDTCPNDTGGDGCENGCPDTCEKGGGCEKCDSGCESGSICDCDGKPGDSCEYGNTPGCEKDGSGGNCDGAGCDLARDGWEGFEPDRDLCDCERGGRDSGEGRGGWSETKSEYEFGNLSSLLDGFESRMNSGFYGGNYADTKTLDAYDKATANDVSDFAKSHCSDMNADGIEDTPMELAKTSHTLSISLPGNHALGINITYGPDYTEYNIFDRTTGKVIGGAGNKPGEYSSFGTERQIDLGNKSSYDVGKTFTSYKEVNGQLDYSKVTGTMRTERTTEGFKTTYREDTWYGSKTTINTFTPNKGVGVSDIELDTFIGTFRWDKHYWSTATGAIEFGFAAEIAMDVMEMLNVDFQFAKGVALFTEVVSTIALQIIPGIQQIKAGVMIGRYFSAAYGVVVATSGLVTSISSLNRLAEIFGGQLRVGGISVTELTDRAYGGGNDLSGINLDSLINTNSSPIGMELSFQRQNTLLPVHNESILGQFKKKEPEIIQGENGMQQSNMPVDMVGMNNIREGHLLNTNESQLAKNTSFDRGVIESVRKPNKSTLQPYDVLQDFAYVYEDDGFKGALLYNGTANVSIARLANNTYGVFDGTVYLLNTKVNGISTLASKLVPMSLDKGSLSIKVSTTIPNKILDKLREQVNSMTVTAESIRQTDTRPNITGSPSFEVKTASFTSKDYFKFFKEALLNGTRQVQVDGVSNGVNGTRVSVKVGAYSTNPAINNGTWKADIDVLQAFGKLFNRFNNEELSYAATVYDEATGMESDPVKSGFLLSYNNEVNIKITNIPQGKKIKLYRKSAGSTLYKYIGMTRESEFLDTLTDIPNVQYLEFYKNEKKTGLKGLVEHKATLFAYKGAYVYFTRPGRPNTWNELQSMTINEDITGLVSTPLGLLVFSRNTTYLLGGTDKFNYTLANVSQSIGCDNIKSIQNVKNAALWVFNNDVMISLGSAINNLTRNRIELPKASIVNSVVVGDIYYLAFDNDEVLKIDFRNPQPIITLETLHGKSLATNAYKLFVLTNEGLVERYSGSYDTLHLKTPKFVGQGLDITKEFNSVNITYEGDFLVNIYINDKKVLNYNISSDIQSVANLKLPVDFNDGLHIYVEFIGTGKIHGYRYIFDYLNLN